MQKRFQNIIGVYKCVILLPSALTSKRNYIVILYFRNDKPTILSKVGFVCPLLRNKIACLRTTGQTKQNKTGRADRSRHKYSCVRLLLCDRFDRFNRTHATFIEYKAPPPTPTTNRRDLVGNGNFFSKILTYSSSPRILNRYQCRI